MKYLPVLSLAVLFACSSSVQTVGVRGTVEVPPDTVNGWVTSTYGNDYGSHPVVYNPFVDSLEIFRRLLRKAENDLNGAVEGYQLELQVHTQTDSSIVDSLQKRVDYYRLRVRAQIVTPSHEVTLPDSVIHALDRGKELEVTNANLRTQNSEASSRNLQLWIAVAVLGLALIGGAVLKLRG